VLDVLLGPGTLAVVLRVFNHGTAAFTFTGALHTYLACAEVTRVGVSGLDGCSVLSGGQVPGDIVFGDGQADVDLSVLEAPGPVRVHGIGSESDGVMLCAQTGFADVVVWNVGERLGADMADLGVGQWRNFVCVEAAATSPITVQPQSSWTGSQTLVITD
jgi:glucose-6-phosphate 1-epimerase